MASWSEKLKDFEIIRWDERNFNLEEHPFAKQAYEAKMWAFVSDYVRIWVLLNYGGVYVDTDYEITGDLNVYLKHSMFIGVENSNYVGTAIIGATQGHWLLREMLEYYDTHPFTLGHGKYNMIPNTMVMTDILIKHGYVRGQTAIVDGVCVVKRNIFYGNGCGGDAVGVHYFRGSWWSSRMRKRSNSKTYHRIKPILIHGKRLLAHILGTERERALEIWVKNLIN